jgi:hypothetical protein
MELERQEVRGQPLDEFMVFLKNLVSCFVGVCEEEINKHGHQSMRIVYSPASNKPRL